jgi:formate dehydrogenase subunit gamma
MTEPSSFEPWSGARVAEICAAYVGVPGGLIPLLHDLQRSFGHVPDAAVPIAAEALNLSRAEVHGVLTFYHDFRRAPPGRHVLKVCRAEACQARGARDAIEVMESELGLRLGETAQDGSVTLVEAYCLGLCASGPAALLDDRPVARLTGERLQRLLEQVRR